MEKLQRDHNSVSLWTVLKQYTDSPVISQSILNGRNIATLTDYYRIYTQVIA